MKKGKMRAFVDEGLEKWQAEGEAVERLMNKSRSVPTSAA